MAARVGVLALQGGFAEHARMLRGAGAEVALVRRPDELAGLDGLVVPGGESTVIDKLARALGLAGPLAQALRGGLPCLATCAGLIYLARRLVTPARGQQTLGVLDVRVERNAFGAQVDSFQTTLDVDGVGEAVAATFIRAPLIRAVGDRARVVARLADGGVVGVRQGALWAFSFHPELTNDDRIHRAWLDMLASRAGGGQCAANTDATNR